MVASALVRFSIFVLLTTILESEEKCIAIENRTNDCDSVRDLSAENLNLLRIVNAGPSSNGKLERFTQIPLQNARNVEVLTIWGLTNNISEDAFINFVNIKDISFSYNELITIQSGTFRNLNVRTLKFLGCGVKTVLPGAFVNLTKLIRLGFTKNNLTKIDKDVFNGLTVRYLTLSNNEIFHIEKLAFANMSNLRTLYLDNNHLSEFNAHDHVSNVANLQRLWLQENNLTQVTRYMLEGLSDLKILDLGSNSISSVEARAFAETPRLMTLVLRYNFLKVLDGAVLPQTGLTELKILYLDNNMLMYLSSNFLFRLNALKLMSIGGNPWQCPCLDSVLRWVADKNVKLSCDMDYFNGKRPVCVAPRVENNNICTYIYEEGFYELFRFYSEVYSPAPFCEL